MCIDGKVVVWKSEEHGWGRERKHCEVTATLYEHWLYWVVPRVVHTKRPQNVRS